MLRRRSRGRQHFQPMVTAWFPDGKDDPRLTSLRLEARDAELWISKGGAIRFAWETAKANLTDSTPNLGDQVNVKLVSQPHSIDLARP